MEGTRDRWALTASSSFHRELGSQGSQRIERDENDVYYLIQCIETKVPVNPFADIGQYEREKMPLINIATGTVAHLAPVVRKPISANPRLNRPNPRDKFVLRLNSVNLLIGRKSSQTNQNGGLTLCLFSALIPSPVRKEKQFRLLDDFSEFNFTILSRTSHSAFDFPALFRVFTSRADRCSAIRT